MSNIDQIIMDIQNPVYVQTYVHNNVEVKKTGRKATKTIGARVITLFEVVAADSTMPQVPEWVQDSDLFVIA